MMENKAESFCYSCLAADKGSSPNYGKDLSNKCGSISYCDNKANYTCVERKMAGERCDNPFMCMNSVCKDNVCGKCSSNADCQNNALGNEEVCQNEICTEIG